MIKIKKNKSIVKRILAFLGAGVCALACMLTLCYSQNITAYARDFDEYYSYNSMEHNVKISNNGSFSKNLIPFPYIDGNSKTTNGITFTVNNNQSVSIVGSIINHDSNAVIYLVNDMLLKAGTYSIFCDSSNADISVVVLIGDFYYSSEFTLLSDSTATIYLQVSKYSTQTFDTSVKFMLCVGTDLDWYPYQQNDFISFNATLVSYPFVEYSTNITSCYFDFYYDGYTYGTLDFILGKTNKNVFSLYTDNKSTLLNNKVTFYAYDTITKAIDYNNSFYFYIMADYINENNSYDNLSIFNSKVVKIIYGSHLDFDKYFKNEYTQNPSAYGCAQYNFISFIDANNNSVNIFIPLFNENDRMYYKFNILYLDNSTLEDYNNGYSNGSLDGYNKGYDKGKNDGYNYGYNVGVDFGYSGGYHDGFNNGVLQNNDYTFLGLLSACIDAPITYFTSLFNFELLGVNLSAFLTGLFTLCVIVTIVRLVLGGK